MLTSATAHAHDACLVSVRSSAAVCGATRRAGGIHLYASGLGCNNSVVTRNVLFECGVRSRMGAILLTGHSNLVANNLLLNSSIGLILWEHTARGNSVVNNAVLLNRVSATVDDKGGKCGCEHTGTDLPRPAFPFCGPVGNAVSHTAYSAPPQSCTEEKQGRCYGDAPAVPKACYNTPATGGVHGCQQACHPTGCCNPGVNTSASDLLGVAAGATLRAWGQVSSEAGRQVALYDGRLRPGSPLHGAGTSVPGGPWPAWLPASPDIGAFPGAAAVFQPPADAFTDRP